MVMVVPVVLVVSGVLAGTLVGWLPVVLVVWVLMAPGVLGVLGVTGVRRVTVLMVWRAMRPRLTVATVATVVMPGLWVLVVVVVRSAPEALVVVREQTVRVVRR